MYSISFLDSFFFLLAVVLHQSVTTLIINLSLFLSYVLDNLVAFIKTTFIVKSFSTALCYVEKHDFNVHNLLVPSFFSFIVAMTWLILIGL